MQKKYKEIKKETPYQSAPGGCKADGKLIPTIKS